MTPLPVSAISGTGTGELLDKLVSLLPPPTSLEGEDDADEKLRVAIIGRPNVGECLRDCSIVHPCQKWGNGGAWLWVLVV